MPSKRLPPASFAASVSTIAGACLAARLPALDSAERQATAADLAGRLQEHFAGRSVYVPAGRAGQLATRDNDMRHAFAQPGPQGVPAGSAERLAQLARQHQLSERRVRSILASGSATPGRNG